MSGVTRRPNPLEPTPVGGAAQTAPLQGGGLCRIGPSAGHAQQCVSISSPLPQIRLKKPRDAGRPD